jgi:SET domain-containing protein
MTYKPLPNYVTIRESPIAGLGLFATEKILAGTYIGIVHITNDSEDNVIRTPLGGFGNHSDTPNCFKIKLENNNSWIGAIRDIEPNEEITWSYTLYEIEPTVEEDEEEFDSENLPDGTLIDYESSTSCDKCGGEALIVEQSHMEDGRDCNDWGVITCENEGCLHVHRMDY